MKKLIITLDFGGGNYIKIRSYCTVDNIINVIISIECRRTRRWSVLTWTAKTLSSLLRLVCSTVMPWEYQRGIDKEQDEDCVQFKFCRGRQRNNQFLHRRSFCDDIAYEVSFHILWKILAVFAMLGYPKSTKYVQDTWSWTIFTGIIFWRYVEIAETRRVRTVCLAVDESQTRACYDSNT